MKKKVFIDGSSGTTGLKIHSRLSKRDDIEVISIDEKYRKDINARKDAINNADIVFLCLPDDASEQAVGLCENKDTVIIDTSTFHRTQKGWVYGFPEISDFRNKINKSKRIANPGCHASGFIALVAPLVENSILDKSTKLSCMSLTGYSGGGKKMIAEYEDERNNPLYQAPRLYSISQNHKHLKEMVLYTGIIASPVFIPVVSSYYSGMEVVVPVSKDDLKCSKAEIEQLYRQYYKTEIVRFSSNIDKVGFVSSSTMTGRDDMVVSVLGNDERMTLVAIYDNLGKGASGAAIQNMNIVLGCDEKIGLTVAD